MQLFRVFCRNPKFNKISKQNGSTSVTNQKNLLLDYMQKLPSCTYMKNEITCNTEVVSLCSFKNKVRVAWSRESSFLPQSCFISYHQWQWTKSLHLGQSMTINKTFTLEAINTEITIFPAWQIQTRSKFNRNTYIFQPKSQKFLSSCSS